MCGQDFSTYACCDQNQLSLLKENMQLVRLFVSSCAACSNNIVKFWCHFTCSSNQSTHTNVTQTIALDGVNVVEEISVFVDPTYADSIFRSCKDIKFGASNQYAMTYIGGGAATAKEMLDFWGTKATDGRPGSPFWIRFPTEMPPVSSGATALSVAAHACNETGAFRCVCFDCEGSCEPAPDQTDDDADVCWIFDTATRRGLLLPLGLVVIMVSSTGFILSLKTVPVHLGGYQSVPNDQPDVTSPSTNEEWPLTRHIGSTFEIICRFCATHPQRVLLVCLTLTAVCGIGLVHFEVETDPIRLWVAPTSTALVQKKTYEAHFGAFYRVEQFIMTRRDGGAVIQEQAMRRLFDLERALYNMSVFTQAPEEVPANRSVRLTDLCFKPLGEACLIESPTAYWQGDPARFNANDAWRDHLDVCAHHAANVNDADIGCLPPFRDPMRAELVLGGYEGDAFLEAKALIVTILLNNHGSSAKAAIAWERAFLDLMKTQPESVESSEYRITFSAETAVEDELSREKSSDVRIVLLSYLTMFVYIATVLSERCDSWNEYLIRSKVPLALSGVALVIASLVVSAGVFSALGVRSTLIIAEVIPFLVLAIGVDNIFIMSDAVARFAGDGSTIAIETQIAHAMRAVGPGMLFSAVIQTLVFSIGTFASMPAVRVFSMYAALAVLVGFVFQVTAFVGLLSLDSRRQAEGRISCLPWIRLAADRLPPSDSADVREPRLRALIRNRLGPALLKPITKFIIVITPVRCWDAF